MVSFSEETSYLDLSEKHHSVKLTNLAHAPHNNDCAKEKYSTTHMD